MICVTEIPICHQEANMAGRKAVTVRIPESRLRRLMRARKVKSQSDLINSLLAEEEERLKSHRVLRETEGTAQPSEIHDRLL
jgi:hypothetical protein